MTAIFVSIKSPGGPELVRRLSARICQKAGKNQVTIAADPDLVMYLPARTDVIAIKQEEAVRV